MAGSPGSASGARQAMSCQSRCQYPGSAAVSMTGGAGRGAACLPQRQIILRLKLRHPARHMAGKTLIGRFLLEVRARSSIDQTVPIFGHIQPDGRQRPQARNDHSCSLMIVQDATSFQNIDIYFSHLPVYDTEGSHTGRCILQ